MSVATWTTELDGHAGRCSQDLLGIGSTLLVPKSARSAVLKLQQAPKRLAADAGSGNLRRRIDGDLAPRASGNAIDENDLQLSAVTILELFTAKAHLRGLGAGRSKEWQIWDQDAETSGETTM